MWISELSGLLVLIFISKWLTIHVTTYRHGNDETRERIHGEDMAGRSDKTIHKDYRIKLLPEHTTDMSRCIIFKNTGYGPGGAPW
jgi:hypothetical protein